MSGRPHADARLPYLDDLIARKLAGPEQQTLPEGDLDFHRREYERLVALLEQASAESALPEGPQSTAALNDLLVRLRLGTGT